MLPLSSTSSLTFFIAGPGLRSSEREEAGGGSLAGDQMDASWMDDPDSCLDSLFSARNKATLRCEDVPNFFPLRFFPTVFFPAEIVVGVALITPFGVYVSCYRSESRLMSPPSSDVRGDHVTEEEPQLTRDCVFSSLLWFSDPPFLLSALSPQL